MNNLLITTFGEYNHLEHWLGGDRNFDVALMNYDYHEMPSDLCGKCVYLDSHTTFKYPGIYEMLFDEPSLLKYDYYWLPDEDILLNTEGINTLFDKARTLNLDLAQPSVENSISSFPSWEQFIHKEGVDIFMTNFVEIMCPLFSRKALLKCMNTFRKSNSGWGLDIVWPKIVGNTGGNMAVINSVVVKHTRKISTGTLYTDLQRKRISPYREKRQLMAEYKVSSIDIQTHEYRIPDNHL